MKHTTKRFLAIIMVLAMCLSLLPGIALAADEYVLVTDVADVLSGGQFVIVANDLAMPTTISSGKFVGVAVTPSGNALSGDLPVWTFEAVDGGVAIKTGDSYLNYNSSTNFKMATASYTWTVTAANGGIVLNSAATTRGIYLQTSSSKFGAYSTQNATASGYVSGLQLYKLSDGTDVPAGCTHEYASEVTAATCTEDGVEIFTCTLCGDSYTETIKATGHNYVDGTCTACGDTVADLSGDYYIAALRGGNYWYMTNDLGTASTKRYVAIDSGLTELPASIASGLADRTFTVTGKGDGTYTISVDGQYLGWTSGNSGALVAEDNALALQIVEVDGAYNIQTTDGARILALNSTSGNNYFAFYGGTQTKALYLVPVAAAGGECAHSNTAINGAVAATCTKEGYTGDTVCADCGDTIATGEAIEALGHTNADGDNYCDVCGTLVATDISYHKTTALNTGDVLLLVNEEAAMELSSMSTTSTIYGIGAGYTDAPVGQMPLTLVDGAVEGTVAFQTADGLYLCWVSGNSLKTSETLDANSSWTVTFEVGGNAVITNSADATRTVRWNKTSPRFACYTSGQQDVQLYKQVIGGGCAHTETTVNGAVAATCTEAGYTGDTVCAACGETVSYGVAVEATGHTEVIVPATVTCTKAGLTEGKQCANCDKVYTAQKDANAAGHSYADGVCTVCGAAEILAPVDAEQILADAYALAAGDALEYTAALTGVITSVDTAYNETYGNITVTIAVAGNEDKPVQCYRLTGEGAADLAVGDTITVIGNIINYNGTIEFTSGCALTSVVKPLPKEYCLVGYINGADYGCNDDYENIGEYIFVDGTLVATFTADSYVFLKTTDNANWYLTETYSEGPSATFINGGSEKMFVPGNYEVTFTLVENADGSVTVSYELGEAVEPPVIDPVVASYYVAGSFNGWNPQDEAYLMIDNGDGTYSLSFAVTAGNHEFKVTDGTWNNSWGSETGNASFTAGIDGTVTITFDGSNVSVSGDCLGEKEPLNILDMHLVGEEGLTGHNWMAGEGYMNGENGIYTITRTNIAAGTYQFKFAANGSWDLNWASGVEIVSGEVATAWFNAMGNSSVTVAEDGSTVIFVFDTTSMDPYTGEGATMCVTVEAPIVEEPDPVVIPTLALKAPALEFKDMICVIAFYTATDLDSVVEMGMLTYTEKVDVVDVNTAAHVIPGATYDPSSGRYFSSSQGIHAKYLGDTVYLACYAKLTDGSYVYTKLAGYGPLTYAKNQLDKSSDMKLKQLCAAMLNYGAAAQNYFGYNTDVLANSTLTAEQIALPEVYNADMAQSAPAIPAEKQGIFANNKGFSVRKPAVSFEGAFSINYFFTPAYTPVDGITLYYWNEADANAADVLTIENATGAIAMKDEGTQFRGDIEGIAAKDLAKAVYVAAVYSDGTTTWTSGVLGYSVGAYCGSQAKGTGTMAELAKATAVYGYHANAYFAQ